MTFKMQIQVINLDRSIDRLQRISHDLNDVGVAWKRFPAIEPRLEDYLSIDLYNTRAAKKYNGSNLKRGEVGCFLSHIGVIESFLSSSDDLLLVFEDDVMVSQSSMDQLSDVLSYLDNSRFSSWHCINLNEVHGKRRRMLKDGGCWKLYRAFYFPLLTSGLVWNRNGAHSFLEYVKKNRIFLPIDQQLRFYFAENGQGLSLEKPIFRLMDSPSTIQVETGVDNFGGWAKFHRKSHNLWHTLYSQLTI